jgi:hypothetical protein
MDRGPHRRSPDDMVAQPKDQKTCQYCGATFCKREHRIRHERTHTQVRPFVCQDCSRPFARHDSLIRHRRTRHPNEAAAERADPGSSQSPSSQTVPILESPRPTSWPSLPPAPSDTSPSNATLPLRPEDSPNATSGELDLFKDLFSWPFGVPDANFDLFDSSDTPAARRPFWTLSDPSRLLDSMDPMTRDGSPRPKGHGHAAIATAYSVIAEMVRSPTYSSNALLTVSLQSENLASAGIESITSQFLVRPTNLETEPLRPVALTPIEGSMLEALFQKV